MVSEVSPIGFRCCLILPCGVISSECCPDVFLFFFFFFDERNCRITVNRRLFFKGENRHACMHLSDLHRHRGTGSHTHVSVLAHLGPVW